MSYKNKLTPSELIICQHAGMEGLEIFKYTDGKNTYIFTNLSDALSPGKKWHTMEFDDPEKRVEFYRKQLDNSLKNDAFCAYRRKYIVTNFTMDNVTPVTREYVKDPLCDGNLQASTLKFKEGFSLIADLYDRSNAFGRISDKTEKMYHIIQLSKNKVDIRGKCTYYMTTYLFDHPIQAIWFILDYVDVYSDWDMERNNFGIRYKNKKSKMSDPEIISYIIDVFQNVSYTKSIQNAFI